MDKHTENNKDCVQSLLPAPVRKTPKSAHLPGKLTQREREVMGYVICGKTSWEISKILGVSKDTVDEHLANVYRKLGVSNRMTAMIAVLYHEIFLEQEED